MKFPKKESHRAGSLKQSNKVHKTGRHRSKGAIGKEFKGKADVKTLSKRAKRELGKEARRNQSLQVRRKKREEVFLKKRHLSGCSAAPILITVIPLREDIDVSEITSLFTGVDETATVATSPHGIMHIGSPILKQRFALTTPPVGNTLATLDAAKVATTVLFVTKTDGDGEDRFVDDWGHEILVACLAQGLPTTVLALNGLETRVRPKKRHDVKASAQKTLAKYLPDEKLVVLDKSTDALGVLRKAGSQKQRSVAYRDRRPHLLAEEVQFQCDPDSPETGTLMVTGYLRGTTLSVNGLVHLPGLGEFQMSRIEASVDPYSLEKSSRADRNSMECQETDRVLEEADPKKQESLDMENTPDPMDAEQTWPTEEELAQAKNSRKIVKKVPKGTSEYQAAWIPDEDAESADGDDVDDEDDDSQMSVEKAQSDEESNEGQDEAGPEEYETITVSEYPLDQERYDKEFDLVEEREAIEKLREAKTDAQFPDEVDTPQNVSAKNRFAKYRGLESFRTSPWDPKENQPFEYSRIFQFENFERTRRRVFQNSEEQEGALPGWYVKLHIVNVRTEMFKAFLTLEDRPLIVFGLLQHERKMSLLNVVLKRTSENRDPIKSKERLVFQCGFRRFSACPIFSQHTNGNKHKYERYFQPDSVVVASMYAPITFNPCPVLCYIEKRDGSLELIATGNVLSVNPDRLVIKRVVLSGHPFKVHKRSAVIRFMFFNREDILWFKPVQLRTKYGRRGHIKEPLGSHGHMKCVFDGQLKSQDTVLMNLFKRVFPKWTYDPYTLTQDSSSSRPTDDVEME